MCNIQYKTVYGYIAYMKNRIEKISETSATGCRKTKYHKGLRRCRWCCRDVADRCRPLPRDVEMLEKQIERYFCSKVKRLGGLAVKLSPAGTAGMPDRLVLLPGRRIAFVEFKAPGKKPRPLQQKRINELQKLGFRAVCLDSYRKVNAFLEAVFK